MDAIHDANAMCEGAARAFSRELGVEVLWVNKFDRETNPLREVGYFALGANPGKKIAERCIKDFRIPEEAKRQLTAVYELLKREVLGG